MNLNLKLRRELILDIGSSHTVVAARRGAPPLRVPTRVVLAEEVVGGAPAAATRSRAPVPARNRRQGTVVFPVKRGKVVHVFAMEQLLKALVAKAAGRFRVLPLRNQGGLLVPPHLPAEEKARLRALLVDVGFSTVRMVEAPLAAAVGCALPLDLPQGTAVMDFGGGTFSLAVLSMGDIVAWSQEPFGGKDLDRAITDYIGARYNAVITADAAEEIKLAIGTVFPPEKPLTLMVRALERRTDIPKQLRLEDNEIRDVLVDACEPIMQGVRRAFAAVPPELAGDVARNGITMVGGGAVLAGLPAFLHERTGLDFKLAADPFNAALAGARTLLFSRAQAD